MSSVFHKIVDDVASWAVLGVLGTVISWILSKKSGIRQWAQSHILLVALLYSSFVSLIVAGALWALLADRPISDAIPSGVILASSVDCKSLGPGWSTTEVTKGRVIVGTGGSLVANVGSVNPVPVVLHSGDLGGTILQSALRQITRFDRTKIDPLNASEPLLPMNTVVLEEKNSVTGNIQFYLMPPFVALNMCQKK